MEISVIIPVYNSKAYIADTVRSLLRQDFEDYEILLIDDGSTDGSDTICRQLEKEYRNIRAFRKPNGGVCSARNYGLEKAQGKYIAFSDNDDECLPGFLGENYALIQRYKADLVRFSRIHQVLKNGKLVSEEKTTVADAFVPSERFYEKLDDVLGAGHGVWSGMYRKEFLDAHHIRFDETMHYGFEDMHFMAQIFQHAPATVLNSHACYIWKMRYDHSTSAKADKNAIDSLLTVVRNEIPVFEKAGYPENRPAEYLERVTEYIYFALRYVSPVKVKIPWRERIDLLRRFSDGWVLPEAVNFENMQLLRKKTPRAYIVLTLFIKKKYSLLLALITVSHWREEIKGNS